MEEKNKQSDNFLNCEQKHFLFNQLTAYMYAIENYQQAIQYAKSAIDLQCKKKGINSISNYRLANLFIKNNQQDSALLIMQNYVDFLVSLNDSAKLVGAYNQFGLIYSNVNQYQNSNKLYQKAIDLIDKTGIRKNLKPILLGNMGYNYKMLGNSKKAIEYLSLDSKKSLKNGETGAHINAEIELVLIEIDEQQYKQVIYKLNNLLTNYENKLEEEVKQQILDLLSQAYLKNNDTQNGFKYYKQYSVLKDSINKTKNIQYQTLLNEYSKSIYNKVIKEKNQRNELIEKDLKLLKNEKKIANQRIKFIIFILIFTIIFIFLVAKRIIDDKKKKAILIQNQLRIKEQDLRIKSTEKKLLELQIAEDNKKINSLALELNIKSDFSDSLINKLETLDKFSFAELRNIELFVQNELGLKSDRAKLQKDIESIGNNFFDSISKKHSNLNESELKLSSFIVLGLSNKEIAISKNIGHNSVKISKNRLKKKLNLSTEIDLTTYLKQFL